jgi:hypothetical protein
MPTPVDYHHEEAQEMTEVKNRKLHPLFPTPYLDLP